MFVAVLYKNLANVLLKPGPVIAEALSPKSMIFGMPLVKKDVKPATPPDIPVGALIPAALRPAVIATFFAVFSWQRF